MVNSGGGILRNTNKKGFTLIELLAVIVILAIIALIATPIIINIVNNAKKSAAVDSAYGYIDSIEKNNALATMDSEEYTAISDGENIDISDISVSLKGTVPTSGIITIEKGRVTKAELCINNYKTSYNGTEAKLIGKCNTNNEEEKRETSISDKAKTLVYSNNKCKTDGTTYNYMEGCYIKGESSNNYVWYNGFMWRIMGINSDGTVKLITDEIVTLLPYGAENTALTYKTNEGYINDWLNNYFYSNLNGTKNIIKEGNYFCSESTNGTSLTIGSARTTCTSGNEVTTKVGLISYDEYLLANASSSYLNIRQTFWTMTASSASNACFVNYSGNASCNVLINSLGVRPVINVEATSIITKGYGTASNYFVLVEDKDSNKKGTLNENVTSGEYVKLEGKIYRVVSKDSDGIKLILDGYYEETAGTTYTMSYGEDNTFTLTSGIGQKLNGDVLTWLGLSNSNKIVETTWYQGNGIGYGFKYTDVLNSTSNGVIAKVGLIGLGEILSSQSSTILTKNYTTTNSYSNASSYWIINKFTITSSAWYNISYNSNYRAEVTTTIGVRPVIKVKTDLTISKGNGTWDNPYEI